MVGDACLTNNQCKTHREKKRAINKKGPVAAGRSQSSTAMRALIIALMTARALAASPASSVVDTDMNSTMWMCSDDWKGCFDTRCCKSPSYECYLRGDGRQYGRR